MYSNITSGLRYVIKIINNLGKWVGHFVRDASTHSIQKVPTIFIMFILDLEKSSNHF